MTRLLSHEEKRLAGLLKETQHKPDEARLAALRQAILAQVPVTKPKQASARFWRWALAGAAICLALGVGLAFWPKAPAPLNETAPIREALRDVKPQKALSADYLNLLDDSQQAVFAWDYLGYGADNPLLLEEEELL